MIKDTSDFNEDSSGNHGIADTTPDIHIDPRAVPGSGQAGFGKPSGGSSLDETAHDTWNESRVSDDTENDWSDGGAVTQREYQSLKTEPDVANVRTEQDLVNWNTEQDLPNWNTEPDLVNLNTEPDLDNRKTERDFASCDTQPDVANVRTEQDLANLNTQPDVQSANTQPDLEPSANQVTNWDPIDYSKPKNSGAHAVKTQGDPPSASKASSSSVPSKPIDQRIGPVSRIQIGEMFANKYEITGHIGRGGMGTVYKAVDLVLGRTVAIKFLRTTRGINQKEVSRFQQEAKAIASLDHHNIIRVHEMSVTAEGEPFFVLEYISGNSLSTEIKLSKGLSVERSIAITMQICDALQHAHDHGVVHRDLKPSNLMIVKSGETEVVKLLDFGIAKRNPIDEKTLLKLTKTGDLFGSPHYMSPEQCEGKAVNTPSDIYSLGIVLFEMLTGKPPFSGNSLLATLDMHKTAATPTVAGKVDEETAKLLDPILSKMLAKNPDDRFARPADVKAALQTLLYPAKEVEPKDARSQSLLKRYFPHGINDARGRKNAALAALSAVCLIGGGAAISFLVQNALAPNMVAKEIDKTPWSTYDYNGQRMFDVGNYKDANVFFRKAYAKALTLSEPQRTTLANRSLREIRMISWVLKDQDSIDWVNKELLSFPELSAPASVDFQRIKRRIESSISAGDSAQLLKQLDLVKVNVPALRASGVDLMEFYNELDSKLTGSPKFELGTLYARLLKAVLQIELTRDVPSDLRALLDFAVKNTDRLTPEQAHLAALLGVRISLPSQSVSRLLEYATDYGGDATRSDANLLLSKLYFQSGRRVAAVKHFSEQFDQLEKRKDASFLYLSNVLVDFALIHSLNMEPGRALPLLVRARAIAACEGQGKMVGGGVLIDLIDYRLVNAYADLGRLDEAIKIMDSLEGNSREGISGPLARLRWLATYGNLLCKSRDYKRASAYLNQAQNLVSRQRVLSSEMQQLSNQVNADLSRISEE